MNYVLVFAILTSLLSIACMGVPYSSANLARWVMIDHFLCYLLYCCASLLFVLVVAVCVHVCPQISFSGVSRFSDEMPVFSFSTDGPVERFLASGLTAGANYTVTVQGRTVAGVGENSSFVMVRVNPEG